MKSTPCCLQSRCFVRIKVIYVWKEGLSSSIAPPLFSFLWKFYPFHVCCFLCGSFDSFFLSVCCPNDRDLTLCNVRSEFRTTPDEKKVIVEVLCIDTRRFWVRGKSHIPPSVNTNGETYRYSSCRQLFRMKTQHISSKDLEKDFILKNCCLWK